MMLSSAQRAVMAASLRDTHGIEWADAILYADCCADALNALEKRTIGEDRYGREHAAQRAAFEYGFNERADEIASQSERRIG